MANGEDNLLNLKDVLKAHRSKYYNTARYTLIAMKPEQSIIYFQNWCNGNTNFWNNNFKSDHIFVLSGEKYRTTCFTIVHV